MGLAMKNWIFLGFIEKPDFYRGGVMKNKYRGGLPKKGDLDSLQF